ncbi:MupG family TIM beta-alpha barrel fold protein [Clostridium sp.]|uniref:DUF871 domain-containing protein n=1 Tax=Clostridium sp. TaxID=1506 RepID=UPI00262156FE|nr:MupG family TIM beta-alpha barrel fold protein [Clostridium sp.]
MGLGISIYPLNSGLEDNKRYIEKSSKLGYSRIFTSMLELNPNKEKALEQVEKYRELLNLSKDLGMKVFIDINPEVLKIIDVNPMDLQFFKELGATGLRLDGMFNGFYESMITYNKFDLDIEINGSFDSGYVNNILDIGCKKGKLVTCHNFYPEKDTGLGIEYFKSCNSRHKSLGLHTAGFVHATNGGNQGPWKSNDGLCTLEKHRGIDVTVQAQELFALGIDDVIIGNAFASDEELQALKDLDENIITLKVRLEEEITEVEKSVFNKVLQNRWDLSDSVVRHTMSRKELKSKEIESRTKEDNVVSRGTILINNNNYYNYKGEVLIVCKDITLDNRRNVIGIVCESHLELLKYITSGKKFKLEE